MGGSGSTLRGNNRTYSNIDYDEAERLRAQAYGMSDGDAYMEVKNALGAYEGSSYSFRLNDALRSDGKLTDNQQQRVDKMDNAMRPIGKDVNVVRNVDTSYMRDVLGISLNGNIADQVNTANSKLKGTILQEKAYMSTSYDASRNMFTARPVQMRIQAPSNAKGIFGTVTGESEIVFARNTKYVIRSISFDGSKIYVDATIVP